MADIEKPIDLFASPRDIREIEAKTGNIYKSVVILNRRANQIAKHEKEEIQQKLNEFAPRTDNLEEIFDNSEQMEISAHYEKLPKPSLVAVHELLDDKIYFRKPEQEAEE